MANKALITTGVLVSLPKAEQGFCIEYTRKLLVTWAARCLTGYPMRDGEDRFWLDVALHKGWVRKDELRLTAAGFGVAAAYLRR